MRIIYFKNRVFFFYHFNILKGPLINFSNIDDRL